MSCGDCTLAEKRRCVRKVILRSGRITYYDRQISVRCVIADVSQGGARLIAGLSHLVPSRFDLTVDGLGLEMQCEVVWRRGNEVGVKFSHPQLEQDKVARLLPSKDTILPLLIAEDDEEIGGFIAEALDEIGFQDPVVFVRNGIELMQALESGESGGREHPCSRPGLILLDLNMPQLDGRVVLEKIKSTPHLKHLPVVVFSCSDAPEDFIRVYELGAAGYFAKALRSSELAETMRVLINYWKHVKLPVLVADVPCPCQDESAPASIPYCYLPSKDVGAGHVS